MSQPEHPLVGVGELTFVKPHPLAQDVILVGYKVSEKLKQIYKKKNILKERETMQEEENFK